MSSNLLFTSTRKTGVTLLALLLLPGLLPRPAAAQDPTGTLEGRITDPSTAAVPAAEVSVRNSQNGFSRVLRSAPDGAYRFRTYLLASIP